MRTRIQTKVSSKNRLLFTGIAVPAVILAGAFIWLWLQRSEATSGTKQLSKSVKFVFDADKVTGWWTSGNNYPDPSMADSNAPKDMQLPIADISVHQCTTATKCTNPEKDTIGAHCFVSTSYMDGTINPDKAIGDMMNQSKQWGVTVTETASVELTMYTPDGDKSYTLHQFDSNTNGSEKTKKGNAQGYIPLNKGYIDVRAVCDEASQLTEAIPALEAIRLSKA